MWQLFEFTLTPDELQIEMRTKILQLEKSLGHLVATLEALAASLLPRTGSVPAQGHSQALRSCIEKPKSSRAAKISNQCGGDSVSSEFLVHGASFGRKDCSHTLGQQWGGQL